MGFAPLTHFYLRQIDSDTRAEGPDVAVSRSSRDEELIAPPNPKPACSTLEVIVSTFTNQYIIGISFIVVAFIKHADTSYYHIRVIHALCSVNLAIGVVGEHNRRALGMLHSRYCSM